MNGFLNNMRQNGGLGMSNLVNAMRNTSRNRIQAGSGTTPNVSNSHAPIVPTNTVPKSPFVNGSRSVPSTIPGSNVPSINGNMSHYPVQNDSGRYGGMNQNDFMKKYNAGSTWGNTLQSRANTSTYDSNGVQTTYNNEGLSTGYPTPGYVPPADNSDNSDEYVNNLRKQLSEVEHRYYSDRTPENLDILNKAKQDYYDYTNDM